MNWLRALPWAGWPIAVLMFLAFVSQRDAVLEAESACDLDTVLEELEAERIAHAATKRNHQAAMNSLAAQVDRERAAKALAQRGAAEANNRLLAAAETITRLELEGETDEIPDSFECLNVFVPAGIIDGLRRSAARCDEDPGSAGPGAARICGDPAIADSAELSQLTYGDSFRYWQRDIETINRQNDQLRAIEQLSDETVR